MIEIASIGVIIIILLLSYNKNNLSLLFPIILLIYPNAVDNLLPGVYLNYSNISNSEPYQILRFIDFILLFIAFRVGSTFKIRQVSISLFLLFYICFLITPYLFGFHKYLFSLFIVLIFICRIFLINIIVKKLYNNSAKLKKMFIGLALGTGLIVLESIIYTIINGSSTLQSGNYANNTLGAILAILLTILVFARLGKYLPRQYILIISLSFIFLLLTGARVAILTFSIVLLTGYFNKTKLLTFLLKGIPIITGVVLISIMVYSLNPTISNKFNISKGINIQSIDDIALDEWGNYGNVSSLIYRFRLWYATIQMSLDNIYFGTGMNSWDFVRWEYDILEPYRLDTHNSYLLLISEFGIPIGLLIIILFFNTIYVCRKFDSPYRYIYWGLIVLSITQLTNASILRLNFLMVTILLLMIISRDNIVMTINQNDKKINKRKK